MSIGMLETKYMFIHLTNHDPTPSADPHLWQTPTSPFEIDIFICTKDPKQYKNNKTVVK